VSDGSKKGRKKTRWTRDFKLRAMSLMDAAQDVTALAAELGVNRELLYQWRRKYLARGPDALQQIGRPLFTSAAVAAPVAAPMALRPEDAVAAVQRRIAELERNIGQQQLDLDFWHSLAACQGTEPEARRAWRDGIYAVIHARVQQQGFEIERMCVLAGVSRAGYYRHWLASKPREEETALRDEIQRLSLAQRKNGYRHNG